MEKADKSDVRQSGKEIFRLFQLDALFQDGHFYKKEELMKKLEVSEATLKRDIRRLKDNYRAPLESSSDGYHYTDRLYKFPALFVTEKEMPAFGLVRKLFMLFKDTPIYKPLLDICENFERPVESEMIDVNQLKFKNSELKENEWFETRIVVAERKVDLVDETVWPVILSSLKENLVLEFDYESVKTNKKSFGRTIEPWQLIFDREQWYLKGMAENPAKPGERGLRTFVVPRMKNIRLTGRHFALPEKELWRLDKYSVGYFGVVTTSISERYQFIFQGSALYYSNAKFSEDKTVEQYTGDVPHKDGALLVSFTSNQRPAVLKEFFPYGDDIIPLAPASFVQEWKDKILAMMQYL
ncbi:MAG: WYL domain-containing protein [Treponema sp.]|nr:WYL domain-containing protein [Treponema sp.]